MKKPTYVKLDDDCPEYLEQWATVVRFVGTDSEFVEFVHDLPDEQPFNLTRREARQLRNFLNKCLEW